MMINWKCSLLVIAVMAAHSLAAQAPLQCKGNELAAHPFKSKELLVTITELNGYKLMAAERRHSGRARISLTIENKGNAFLLFSPQDLGLVGKDGIQVFPIYELNAADDTVPMTLRLAPGAHVKVKYVLTGRLHFPAKIYLGDLQVAEILE